MKHFRKLTGPYFAWLVLFVLIPLVLIAIYAFTTSGNPVKTLNFTLMNFAKINEPTYIKVFIKSIEMGVLTTGVCLILGYPMAYLIAKCPEEMQDMLIMAVTIPTWINMLLRISPVTMMYTNFSVVVGMVCNFMPFMIIPIHTSLRKMDNSLIEAAMDLGANPFQTFQKVVLKLSMPGVINGIVMVFLMAISSFVIPKLLGGGQFVLIGNLIESQFVSVGDWNFGSAISLILAVLILVAMRLMKKMDVQDN